MKAADQFKIEWRDSGAEPECAPDPHYPTGVVLDLSKGQQPSCAIDLPYPALRVGYYLIDCQLCGLRVACTTAGRIDDPRRIKVACHTQ
jgi:hypothetical protein